MVKVSERIARLTTSGVRMEYADPVAAFSAGLAGVDVHSVQHEGERPFVMLTGVARSECAYGQSSFLDRSNFRSLVRDYPGELVEVRYTNVSTLGFFVHSVSDHLFDVLCEFLAGERMVCDEDDLSALESDEIFSAWDDYLFADLSRALPEALREKALDADSDALRNMFFTVAAERDYHPEAASVEIVWDDEECGRILTEALGRL